MTFWENLIFWAVTGIFSIAATKLMLECKKQAAVRDGVRAILRDRILQNYNHYCEKGWAPFYAVENVTNMYNAYHDLDGNGAVTEIYHKFLKLPQQSFMKGEPAN